LLVDNVEKTFFFTMKATPKMTPLRAELDSVEINIKPGSAPKV